MSAADDRFADVFDPDETDRRYGDAPFRQRTQMPLFSRVVLIIDMVLCGFRGLMVVFGVVGYVVMKQQLGAIVSTALFEIGTGLGIVVFGLLGDLLLLLGRTWAMGLAYLALFFTIGSMAVGLWQLTIQYAQLAGNDPAQQIGAVIGVVLALGIRLGIVSAYGVALSMYSKWAGQLPHDEQWMVNAQ